MAKIVKNSLGNFLVVFLIITNIATLGFLVYKSWQDPVKQFNNPYPLLDPARNFIPQEHYIVNLQPLRDKLNAFTDEFGRERVSIYIEYLNTGANISINPQNYIYPASLAKVPLAMAVMKKVEKGEWKLSNELVLIKGDRDASSGDGEKPLYEYAEGTRFTIEKLLEELLENSDNTAFNILMRNMSPGELNEIIDALGLEDLFRAQGRVSAKEYSRIFRALYNASFLDRENSQKIIVWLSNAAFDKFLSRGIPEGVIFSHKYGEQTDLSAFNDSGIVYLPMRPYLITVTTAGNSAKSPEENETEIADFMRRVSEETYKYFLKY